MNQSKTPPKQRVGYFEKKGSGFNLSVSSVLLGLLLLILYTCSC